jgi:hypothetical protein
MHTHTHTHTHTHHMTRTQSLKRLPHHCAHSQSPVLGVDNETAITDVRTPAGEVGLDVEASQQRRAVRVRVHEANSKGCM